MHFRSSPKADLDSSWRPPHGGRWQFGVPEFLVGCKVFAPKSKHRGGLQAPRRRSSSMCFALLAGGFTPRVWWSERFDKTGLTL